MITCVVLAAGESKRFGSPKPLASISGLPAIAVICDMLLASEVERVIVVLGHEAEAVRPAVPANARVRCIVNEGFRRGMTSSFQTGLSLAPSNATGIMLLPADMPFVQFGTFKLLCQTFEEQDPLILVPTYHGRSGHPPIFASSLSDDFKALKPDEPLSGVQHRLKQKTLFLPVEDPGVIRTYSTPQELSRLLQK